MSNGFFPVILPKAVYSIYVSSMCIELKYWLFSLGVDYITSQRPSDSVSTVVNMSDVPCAPLAFLLLSILG